MRERTRGLSYGSARSIRRGHLGTKSGRRRRKARGRSGAPRRGQPRSRAGHQHGRLRARHRARSPSPEAGAVHLSPHAFVSNVAPSSPLCPTSAWGGGQFTCQKEPREAPRQPRRHLWSRGGASLMRRRPVNAIGKRRPLKSAIAHPAPKQIARARGNVGPASLPTSQAASGDPITLSASLSARGCWRRTRSSFSQVPADSVPRRDPLRLPVAWRARHTSLRPPSGRMEAPVEHSIATTTSRRETP